MTTKPAEAARLRQAFAATSPADVPRADCPPAETLWEGVRGELGHAELSGLLCHVAVCPVCAEAWRLGMELDVEAAGEEPASRRPAASAAARSLPSWVRPLAAAAMVVLAVGVAFWQQVPSTRSGAGKLELLSGEELSKQDPQLRWSPVAGATSYRLEIRTLEGADKVYAASGLTLPETRVPPTMLASLPPGTEVTVRIEALRDGEVLAREAFSARIR